MANLLKQSTAAVVTFGPFVLPSDGVTLVTTLVSALDHASTGIFLSKNGGSGAVRHAAVTATTYDAYGMYLVTLDTTDTNTLGRLRVYFAAAASCLPVWRDFEVLPANVFDSFVSGSSNLKVDVDTVKTQAVTCAAGVTVLASVGTTSTSTAQTGDSFARIGAPAGASVSADIAAVKTDTAAVKTQTDKLTFTVANQVDANALSLATTLRPGIRKNTALANFQILMTDSTNHNPATGLTVTVQRAIDGGALGSGTIANITEISNGLYRFDFGAGDLNGATIVVRCTATGADDLDFTIVTTP